MLGRWAAFEHGKSHARSLAPVVAGRLLDAVAAGQLALDDVEAFGDAVAAEARVAGFLPDRLDVVAGFHHVLAPHDDRVDAQLSRQLVDGALDGESGLRSAVAAKAATRRHVRVVGVTVAPLVEAAVGRQRRA